MIKEKFNYVVLFYRNVKDIPFQPMIVRDTEYTIFNTPETYIFRSGLDTFQKAQEDADQLNEKVSKEIK